MSDHLGDSGSFDIHELSAFLDKITARILRGEIIPAVELLGLEIREWYGLASCSGKVDAFLSTCRSHPLQQLLMQDPYTKRAYDKPRGYAGDAVMLDYVYEGIPPAGTSDLGCQVFQCTTRLPNGQSVLWRREFLASVIDSVADRFSRPTIASIACGHLRECQRSLAVADKRVATVIALDQDRESLAVVEQEQPPFVRPIHGTIAGLLQNKIQLPPCELIYSAGLFDYLPDRIAARLLRQLCRQLTAGGKLIVANFLPDSYGRGYMEAFMDWQLIYRTEHELAALAEGAAISRQHTQSLRRDPMNNVAYLEISIST